MKRLLKVFLGILTIGVILCAGTAFAQEATLEVDTDLLADGTLKVTGTYPDAESGKEITLLVLNSAYDPTNTTHKIEDYVVYIDQGTTNDTGKVVFPEIPLENSKKYLVKMGGTLLDPNDATVSIASGIEDNSIVYGEVDGATGITLNDAILVLKFSAQLETPDANQAIAAEVDGATGISLNDAILVLKYSAQLINSFPVESAGN